MKSILLALPAIGLVSCTTPMDQNNGAYDPAASNPYAAPSANPYQAPSANAPYQPVDPVNPPANSNPYASQSTPANTPTAPDTASSTPDYTPRAPSAGGGSHVVVAGDSLWGLSRKYGTTVEAIQAANGLSDTTIRKGQTLVIPR